jgi:hypothetical protein
VNEEKHKLRVELINLEKTAKEIRGRKEALEVRADTFKAKMETTSSLQERSSSLLVESGPIFQRLAKVGMTLSRIQEKSQAVATDLRDCGYAVSRREMAGSLRAIVVTFDEIDMDLFGLDKGRLEAVSLKLAEVESRSERVLAIIDSSGTGII